MVVVHFEVLGIPKSKGNLKFWGMSKKGKPIIANKGGGEWENQVRYAVQREMNGKVPTEKPVSVSLFFTMPIPKSLHRKIKNGLLSSYHAKKPDIDKCCRNILDSMTGIVFKDDSQVSILKAKKIYGYAPGVSVQVEEIE